VFCDSGGSEHVLPVTGFSISGITDFRAGPDVRIQRLDGLMHSLLNVGFLSDSPGPE